MMLRPHGNSSQRKKIDWTEMGKFTVDVFKDSKDIKMIELVLWENKLLNFFSDHIKKISEDILHDDLV